MVQSFKLQFPYTRYFQKGGDAEHSYNYALTIVIGHVWWEGQVNMKAICINPESLHLSGRATEHKHSAHDFILNSWKI